MGAGDLINASGLYESNEDNPSICLDRLRVKAVIVDEDGNEIGATNCGELRVDESAYKEAITRKRTIAGETLANALGTDMVDRKTIFIQPLDGDMEVGFESNHTAHVVGKLEFFESRFKSPIPVFIRKKGSNGDLEVAITEAK